MEVLEKNVFCFSQLLCATRFPWQMALSSIFTAGSMKSSPPIDPHDFPFTHKFHCDYTGLTSIIQGNFFSKLTLSHLQAPLPCKVTFTGSGVQDSYLWGSLFCPTHISEVDSGGYEKVKSILDRWSLRCYRTSRENALAFTYSSNTD